MENFKKLYRIGRIAEIRSVYVTAKFMDGKLSLTGVEGPLSNGDCKGSCGQITIDASRFESFATGWTPLRVERLARIWDRWHLNDLSPADSAMIRDGWLEKARIEMIGYNFELSPETYAGRKAAESAALDALRTGNLFEPTQEQTRLATLPTSYTEWKYNSESVPDARPGYVQKQSTSYSRAIERKTLGWLYPFEHSDGLLTRVHPETGNGYGSKWYFHKVPDSVLLWLKALPDSDLQPAWH